MKAKVGLVTVTYNSEEDIEEFLESCASQTHQNFKIYIIDNNSCDETIYKIKKTNEKYKLPMSIRQISTNMGISYGNNVGIKQAIADDCEWVILINNDTAFESSLISSLVNSDNQVNIPLITYYDEPDRIWFYKGFFNKLKGFTGAHYMKNKFLTDIHNNEIEYTDYSPTCCMAIHKNIFREIGLMDEDFFVYFDDTDFTYRLLRNNIKIKIHKKTLLKHKVGSSTGGVMSNFTIEATSKNRVIFIRKHFSIIHLIFYLPIFLFFYFYRFIILSKSLEKFIISIRATFEGCTKRLSSPQHCD